MSNEHIGKIAYDAYCKERGWKSVRGDSLPQWEQQDQSLRTAWVYGAQAVVDYVNTQNQGSNIPC